MIQANRFIQCPRCKKEHAMLHGFSLVDLEQDLKNGFAGFFKVEDARKNANEDGEFFPCYNCGYIFPTDHETLWQELKENEKLFRIVPSGTCSIDELVSELKGMGGRIIGEDKPPLRVAFSSKVIGPSMLKHIDGVKEVSIVDFREH